jgi:hypothetical protein
MKKKLLVILVSFIAVFALGNFLMKTRYFVSQEEATVQAVWTNKIGFILIGDRALGKKANGVQTILTQFTGMTSFDNEIESVSLITVSDGKFKVFKFHNFNSKGNLYPLENRLFYDDNKNNILCTSEWNGSSWRQLDPNEATAIRSKFKLYSDLFADTGWHSFDERTISNDPLGSGVKFNIDQHEIELRRVSSSTNGLIAKSISISIDGNTKTISSYKTSWQNVEEGEYQNIFAK